MQEVFVDIKGYEGNYQISNLGRVWSVPRKVKMGNKERIVGGVFITHRFGWDYPYVSLHKSSQAKTVSIHRLLAIHFIPNPENKPQVNHKDGNKKNCSLDNLEWVTASENIQHSHDTGLCNIPKGIDNYKAKYTNEKILKIRALAKHLKNKDLATIFNIHQADISNIVNYKRWAHLP